MKPPTSITHTFQQGRINATIITVLAWQQCRAIMTHCPFFAVVNSKTSQDWQQKCLIGEEALQICRKISKANGKIGLIKQQFPPAKLTLYSWIWIKPLLVASPFLGRLWHTVQKDRYTCQKRRQKENSVTYPCATPLFPHGAVEGWA